MRKIIRLTESDLHNIIRKSVSSILAESHSNIVTYYHGGDKNVLLFLNGILWLSDSLEYAKDYAEARPNPVLYAVTVDESQLNCCAFTDYGDGFDPYDPDNDTLEKMRADGYNCYSLYYDENDAEGIALLDSGPIIKIEEISF
jgi:hypothetical protein